MKILIHAVNFAPELVGIGKYVGEMAIWLAARGHEVRVVTAHPYYPDWKVTNGYSSSAWTKQDWQGVRVWRCPIWVPRKPRGFARLTHLVSFALSSFPVMLRQIVWRPKIVWVVEPTFFCFPAALIVARLSGARSWLHIQDFEVDAAFSLGLISGSDALRKTAELTERWLLNRFDVVSSISEKMLTRAMGKGAAAERLTLFPNWVDLNSFHKVTAKDEIAYRSKLGIPENAIVVLYSGSFSPKQGLEILPEVVRICSARSSTLCFVICGNGQLENSLREQTSDLRGVKFFDLQPAETLPQFLCMADIHLLPQRREVADLVLPSKLTGMLASGRSIVAGADADTQIARIVDGCGIVVPPQDAEAMAFAVLQLAENPDLRSQLGVNGAQFAKASLGIDTILAAFVRRASTMCSGD